jgi:hypothetical protein
MDGKSESESSLAIANSVRKFHVGTSRGKKQHVLEFAYELDSSGKISSGKIYS